MSQDRSFFFWNCAKGLLGKMHTVKNILLNQRPVAFFIAESDIKRDFDLRLLNVPGYRIEMSNTISLHGKSRLLAFINNSYSVKRLPSLEFQANEFIVLKFSSYIITGVYFPFKLYGKETPQGNLLRNIDNLKMISSTVSKDSCIFVGDFNIDINKPCHRLDLLRSWTDAHGLEQLIASDTRSRLVQLGDDFRLESSRIDHLYTTDTYNVSVNVVSNNFSDHSVVEVGIKGHKIPCPKRSKTIIVDWRKYDPDKMAISVSSFLETLPANPSKVHDSVVNAIISAMNIHCPKRVAISRQDSHIVSAKVCALTKKRDRCVKEIRKLKDAGLSFNNLALKARSLGRHLKRVIIKEKTRIIRRKLDGCSPRSFWQTIELLFGRIKDKVCPVRDELNNQVSDSVLVEMFSSFFQKKVSDLANQDDAEAPQLSCEGSPTLFSHQDILRAIEAMKPKRSSGPDEITMSIIRDCKEVLIPHFVTLFNNVLLTGLIPSEWKRAIIRPILKKGDPADINNYRPISNLSSISKVFEKVILHRLDALYPWLDGLNQHGFRSCHNTTTAAIEIQYLLSTYADKKCEVAIYSIDLSAAFDLINPRIFSEVCLSLRIDSWTCRVLVNFLRDRLAYVSINQDNSSPFGLKLGCAQGSTLGPKIFNIYVSGLATCLERPGVHVVSYADDSYVVVSADSYDSLLLKIESVMEEHLRWLKQIGMFCNIKKSEAMILFNSTPTLIGPTGNQVLSGSSMNVLGFTFDSHLKWSLQTENVIHKTKRVLYGLKQIRPLLNRTEFSRVITSHAFSLLYYGMELWFPILSFRDKARIRSVHYKIIRLLEGDIKCVVSRHILDEWSRRATPDQWSDYCVSKTFIGILNNRLPTRINESITAQCYKRHRDFDRWLSYDKSVRKIGRQSFCNRLTEISSKLDFDWINLSKDAIRTNLKRLFFPYFSQ